MYKYLHRFLSRGDHKRAQTKPQNAHRKNQELFVSLVDFSCASLWALFEVVNARVGMVETPVEPVVFKHEYFLQLLSGERAGSCFAFEVPGAASFRVDQLKSTTLSLLKELQS